MVNTFLPFQDVRASAEALDRRRLGKQRVEAYQIWLVLGRAEAAYPPYDDLGDAPWAAKRAWATEAARRHHAHTGRRLGWATHPAVVLWIGHRDALAAYYNTMCDVWAERGGRNVLLKPLPAPAEPCWPAWTADARVHNAFRWQLLRKELLQPTRGVLERPWYIYQPAFYTATPVPDYLWEP